MLGLMNLAAGKDALTAYVPGHSLCALRLEILLYFKS